MSNLRLSQVAGEVIASETANVRLSQIAIEAVTDLPSNSNLRLSQIALEVLVPAALRTQIIGGNFQDASGQPLANGRLEIRLSTDAMSPDGQVSAGISATVPLGSNGSITGFASLWSTDQLDAGGDSVFYAVTAYSSSGLKVWGTWQETVPNVLVYDIGGWTATVPAG